MTAIDVGSLAQLDAAIEALPNNPAVFLLWPKEGDPYLSKTALLRRRLLRLLKERERPSRLLNLRHTVRRIEYRLTGSAFESAWCSTNWRGRHFPETYLDLLKLRMPPYVKIVLGNPFPRSHITTHLTRVGRPLLRAVPIARVGGAVRRAIPGPVPNAALPGGPGALARTSRLHLRRDGHVPAALPGSGGAGGIRPRGSARGGVSAHRWPVAAGRHRALARPAERGDAVRGRGAAA